MIQPVSAGPQLLWLDFQLWIVPSHREQPLALLVQLGSHRDLPYLFRIVQLIVFPVGAIQGLENSLGI